MLGCRAAGWSELPANMATLETLLVRAAERDALGFLASGEPLPPAVQRRRDRPPAQPASHAAIEPFFLTHGSSEWQAGNQIRSSLFGALSAQQRCRLSSYPPRRLPSPFIHRCLGQAILPFHLATITILLSLCLFNDSSLLTVFHWLVRSPAFLSSTIFGAPFYLPFDLRTAFLHSDITTGIHFRNRAPHFSIITVGPIHTPARPPNPPHLRPRTFSIVRAFRSRASQSYARASSCTGASSSLLSQAGSLHILRRRL